MQRGVGFVPLGDGYQDSSLPISSGVRSMYSVSGYQGCGVIPDGEQGEYVVINMGRKEKSFEKGYSRSIYKNVVSENTYKRRKDIINDQCLIDQGPKNGPRICSNRNRKGRSTEKRPGRLTLPPGALQKKK